MATFAMWVAERGASVERTYGYYRSEVTAALLNGPALWLIVGWILWEAYHRFHLDEHHVEGLSVLLVGIGGLMVNLIVAYILHRNSEHSLNVEGAFQHVLADLLGSVGVVIAGIVILTIGWTLIDPILSVVIGLLIMRSSWALTMKVFHVLLEGAPKHIDVYKLRNDIEELDGLTLIHDVHCWTITSGNDAFTAHALVDPSYTEALRVCETGSRASPTTGTASITSLCSWSKRRSPVRGKTTMLSTCSKPRSHPGNRDLPWRLHVGPVPYPKRPIPSRAAAT